MAAGHGLERLTAWLQVPRLPHIRQLGLSIVASSLGFGVFIAATAVFLVRQVGLGAAQAGLVFSVANGFALLSALFLGSVVDRIGGGRAVLAAGGLAVMGSRP
jgi:nitrate/nitrite transporter NarK